MDEALDEREDSGEEHQEAEHIEMKSSVAARKRKRTRVVESSSFSSHEALSSSGDDVPLSRMKATKCATDEGVDPSEVRAGDCVRLIDNPLHGEANVTRVDQEMQRTI